MTRSWASKYLTGSAPTLGTSRRALVEKPKQPGVVGEGAPVSRKTRTRVITGDSFPIVPTKGGQLLPSEQSWVNKAQLWDIAGNLAMYYGSF